MRNLFITADEVGAATGGGAVTFHESEALKSLGPCEIWGRSRLVPTSEHVYNAGGDPWGWDRIASLITYLPTPLLHLYAGTFGETVRWYKNNRSKVTYTIAAHDKEVSRQEHEQLGWGFPYTHLTDPELWKRYIEGYRLADVIICPSKVAERTVRNYGPDFLQKRIEVIPHGHDIPEVPIAPLPKTFTVGYLGAIGADKGLIYLLHAWKQLNYKDAVLKIAGKDSTHPWVKQAVLSFNLNNVQLCGWVDNVSEFYDSLSCYVQPSATEGFGIEVLEAQARGRVVICSGGAGAVDNIPLGWAVPACNVEALTARIDAARGMSTLATYEDVMRTNQGKAYTLTWEKVRAMYVKLWKGLLDGSQ